MWLFDLFSFILQNRYVELQKSRSISDSPLDFEITRVDYISYLQESIFFCYNNKLS